MEDNEGETTPKQARHGPQVNDRAPDLLFTKLYLPATRLKDADSMFNTRNAQGTTESRRSDMKCKLSALKVAGFAITCTLFGCVHAHAAPPPPAPPPPVAAPPPAPSGPVPLERWAEVHPEAARELGDWAHAHPQAAQRFFEWDAHHPEKSHEFVTWTITHPAQGIDAFISTHPRWPFFDKSMAKHRPAAEAFMAWCRRHPPAAEALMNHPRALEWAGHNLYKM
jgi:hypothetical protein